MNIRDLLTLIGGLLGVIAPILQAASSENTRLAGQICMSVALFLVGSRGFKLSQTAVEAPALVEDIERRISIPVAPLIAVAPRQVAIPRRFPEQPWNPEPSKTREQLRAEQDAWLASNQTKL
jgi:hypothetical protein